MLMMMMTIRYDDDDDTIMMMARVLMELIMLSCIQLIGNDPTKPLQIYENHCHATRDIKCIADAPDFIAPEVKICPRRKLNIGLKRIYSIHFKHPDIIFYISYTFMSL